MYNQEYKIYGEDKKEIKYWASKKLEDVKKDILDMIDYYGLENIDSIRVNLNIYNKKEN